MVKITLIHHGENLHGKHPIDYTPNHHGQPTPILHETSQRQKIKICFVKNAYLRIIVILLKKGDHIDLFIFSKYQFFSILSTIPTNLFLSKYSKVLGHFQFSVLCLYFLSNRKQKYILSPKILLQ